MRTSEPRLCSHFPPFVAPKLPCSADRGPSVHVLTGSRLSPTLRRILVLFAALTAFVTAISFACVVSSGWLKHSSKGIIFDSNAANLASLQRSLRNSPVSFHFPVDGEGFSPGATVSFHFPVDGEGFSPVATRIHRIFPVAALSPSLVCRSPCAALPDAISSLRCVDPDPIQSHLHIAFYPAFQTTCLVSSSSVVASPASGRYPS